MVRVPYALFVLLTLTLTACGSDPVSDLLFGEHIGDDTGRSDLEDGPVQAPAYRDLIAGGAVYAGDRDSADTVAQYLAFLDETGAASWTEVKVSFDRSEGHRAFWLSSTVALADLADPGTVYLGLDWAGADAPPALFPQGFVDADDTTTWAPVPVGDDDALYLDLEVDDTVATVTGYALQVRDVAGDAGHVEVRVTGQAARLDDAADLAFSFRYVLAPEAATADHEINGGLLRPHDP